LGNRIDNAIKSIAGRGGFQENPSFYIYDLDGISATLGNLKGALPENVSLYYAMKANPAGRILEEIRGNAGAKGVEIASFGEYEKAISAGFSPEQIIFTGPGKTPFEIGVAVNGGIRLLNIESMTEAVRASRASLASGRTTRALVRINPRYTHKSAHTHMAGESSKLGIDEDASIEQYARIAGLPGLDVEGIHVFSGSGVLEADELIRYFGSVLDLANRIEKGSGQGIRTVDFGGGFGIDYSGEGREVDLRRVGAGLERVSAERGFSGKELVLELGRYVVGPHGLYVSEIVDIKESGGKKHAIAAGGINHQRRPCAVERNHPIRIMGMNRPEVYPGQPSIENERIDVDGPLCLTDDILGMDVYCQGARIGDLVVVGMSGAYGKSMAAEGFLSHPPAQEYFLSGERVIKG